jgi:hypothetical protein
MKLQFTTGILHIQEVPGSNLSLETSYPYRGILWFSSVLQANTGIKIRPQLIPSKSFPILHPVITLSFNTA